MEKNIHDNDFDDYVRHSFDEYEELPASNMWNKIEGDLAPDDRKKRPLLWWWSGYRWQTVAAAMILLLASGIFAGRNYYENKLKALAAEKEKVRQMYNREKEQSETTRAMQPVPSLMQKNEEPEEILSGKAIQKKDKTNLTTQNWPGNAPLDVVQPIPQQPLLVKKDNPKINLDQLINDANSDTSSAVIKSTVSNNASVTGVDIAPKAKDTVGFLPLLPLVRLEKPHTGPTFSVFPDQLISRKKEWYTGFHITPLRLMDHEVMSRRGPGRPRFASRTERAGPAADLWLKAGGTIHGRWGWESGIGYRSVSRSAVHFPRFLFGQGTYRPDASAHARNYDFAYNLDTYGGSAEVTVRMEQVDNNNQIGQEEAVSLRVFTDETMQMLRVPLSLTARLGTEKLTGVVKGGLTGNFIVRNQLDITARNSTTARFRTNKEFTVNLENGNRFFLGYQVSAGLNYRIDRNWSVVLEPTLAGDFSGKTSGQNKLPGLISMGLNVGVNKYW